MKTPKPGTPKRFIKIGTKNKQVCYILNKICLETVKEWKLSYLAEKTISQGWKKSYDELKIGYAKQSETLNDLSKEYNNLVCEHNKVKSDYLKATNAFVEEKQDFNKEGFRLLMWVYGLTTLAIIELCFIIYLLIK